MASLAPAYASELDRITRLPRRLSVNCARFGLRYSSEAEALVRIMTERFARGPRTDCACKDLGHPCIVRLNPAQAWALWEMPRADGLLGLMGVGSGKSMLSLLAPLAFPSTTMAVLLAEPSQRIHYRNQYLRLREHFHVPSFIFDKAEHGTFIVPGAPVLHFRPYTMLSRSTDLLEKLAPDLIIADECHRIARRENSNTSRVIRYFTKSNDRNVRLCAWSGTLVKKSLCDISHLSAFALGLGSPYPINPDEAEAWANVLDPIAMPDRTSHVAQSLRRVFGDGRAEGTLHGLFFEQSTREGLQRRVNETLGVVTTRGSAASVALYFHERQAPVIPAEVRAALVQVRQESVRPDGEELVEPVEIARCAREVASGFFYYWEFGDQPIEDIENWFARRKAFGKALRAKLMRREVHLDSPAMCANAAARAFRDPRYDGELPVWPEGTWPPWIAVKNEVKHDSRTRWIHEYLARDAAAWAKEHVGIVWYLNNAFGRRVAEILGVPCHGGGQDAESSILAEDGSRSIVASIKAHGSGRDGLQYKFSKQLIAEIPSGNAVWEQLVGRLCREGQKEDAIDTWIYLHVHENRDALRSAIREAEFVEQSTGAIPLLLTADMDFDL